jgi:hypothetical protein
VPTSFSEEKASRLLDFTVALAAAARLFTVDQLARHPYLSSYRQPSIRAREFVTRYPDVFESTPGPRHQPSRRRLTAKAKRERGLTFRSVSGESQRAEHWLGIGDIWLELTFHGGRPTEWRTEPDGQFDIYCVWNGTPYLIEYQRTPITERQWMAKWERRIQWYRAQKWHTPPKVVLVNATGQQEGTIHLPRNTIHVRDINHLHHALRTPRV